MKNILPAFILLFLSNLSSGQEVPTAVKLFRISISLGVTNRISVDTLPGSSNQIWINNRESAAQSILLKAAESYKAKDYENSNNYSKKAGRLSNTDLFNLKYVILIGSFANLKDVKQTAKYFYIADKTNLIDPENMKIIRKEIRLNFKRDIFDEALSYYYYYHARLRILDEIKFDE